MVSNGRVFANEQAFHIEEHVVAIEDYGKNVLVKILRHVAGSGKVNLNFHCFVVVGDNAVGEIQVCWICRVTLGTQQSDCWCLVMVAQQGPVFC